MRLRIYTLFLFLLVFQFGFSQDTDTKKAYTFSGRFHYGQLLNIHPFFPEVGAAKAFELNFTRQLTGQKYWHQFHKNPKIGYSLMFTDLGNKSILGYSVGSILYAFFNKPIGKRFEWNARTGAGLAFITERFDSEANPDNYVIGSRIAALVLLETGFGVRLTDHLTLSLGGSFTHYSNGHYRVPNIGANSINGVLGLRYDLRKSAPEMVVHEVKSLDTKWRFNFDVSLGFHEIEGTVLPSGGPLYPVYSSSIYLSKRFSYKSNFLAGFNWNYFTAYHDQIINQQIFGEKEKSKSQKMLVFAGYELIYGHLAVFARAGINVYYPLRHELIAQERLKKKASHLYNTNNIGFQYYMRSTRESLRLNPYLGVGFRTLGGKADFVEFRVGMAI